MRTTLLLRAAAAATVLLLVAGLSAFAIPPVAPAGAFEGQARVLLAADLGRLDPMLEAQGLFADPQEASWYRALTLGAYYRLHRNLKVAQLFENFFATTYYTADDGLALGGSPGDERG